MDPQTDEPTDGQSLLCVDASKNDNLEDKSTDSTVKFGQKDHLEGCSNEAQHRQLWLRRIWMARALKTQATLVTKKIWKTKAIKQIIGKT